MPPAIMAAAAPCPGIFACAAPGSSVTTEHSDSLTAWQYSLPMQSRSVTTCLQAPVGRAVTTPSPALPPPALRTVLSSPSPRPAPDCASHPHHAQASLTSELVKKRGGGGYFGLELGGNSNAGVKHQLPAMPAIALQLPAMPTMLRGPAQAYHGAAAQQLLHQAPPGAPTPTSLAAAEEYAGAQLMRGKRRGSKGEAGPPGPAAAAAQLGHGPPPAGIMHRPRPAAGLGGSPAPGGPSASTASANDSQSTVSTEGSKAYANPHPGPGPHPGPDTQQTSAAQPPAPSARCSWLPGVDAPLAPHPPSSTAHSRLMHGHGGAGAPMGAGRSAAEERPGRQAQLNLQALMLLEGQLELANTAFTAVHPLINWAAASAYQTPRPPIPDGQLVHANTAFSAVHPLIRVASASASAYQAPRPASYDAATVQLHPACASHSDVHQASELGQAAGFPAAAQETELELWRRVQRSRLDQARAHDAAAGAGLAWPCRGAGGAQLGGGGNAVAWSTHSLSQVPWGQQGASGLQQLASLRCTGDQGSAAAGQHRDVGDSCILPAGLQARGPSGLDLGQPRSCHFEPQEEPQSSGGVQAGDSCSVPPGPQGLEGFNLSLWSQCGAEERRAGSGAEPRPSRGVQAGSDLETQDSHQMQPHQRPSTASCQPVSHDEVEQGLGVVEVGGGGGDPLAALCSVRACGPRSRRQRRPRNGLGLQRLLLGLGIAAGGGEDEADELEQLHGPAGVQGEGQEGRAKRQRDPDQEQPPRRVREYVSSQGRPPIDDGRRGMPGEIPATHLWSLPDKSGAGAGAGAGPGGVLVDVRSGWPRAGLGPGARPELGSSGVHVPAVNTAPKNRRKTAPCRAAD